MAFDCTVCPKAHLDARYIGGEKFWGNGERKSPVSGSTCRQKYLLLYEKDISSDNLEQQSPRRLGFESLT
jgi:hypothetical protein